MRVATTIYAPDRLHVASTPWQLAVRKQAMNQQELEEFAQFLRMAELSGGRPEGYAGQHKRLPSWWTSFPAKSGLCIGMFVAAIALFRNFGHTLA